MKKDRICSLLTLSLLCLWGAAQADEPEVQFKPVSISGQFDNGQIISGRTNEAEQPPFNSIDLGGDYFNRTGVWLTQDAVVNKRLEMIVGVGGVFWYALPTRYGDPASNQTEFGPGISQAQAVYTFGDLNHPTAQLQMGYFPYKYNEDAKDLGEYLLRSGTYPGYLVSGGWNMVASADYIVEGFRLNFSLWDGKFESDFLLPMEHDLPPLFSVSPTYVATIKPVAGVRIGAGIDCNHCISVKPSAESPHQPENEVIKTATYDSTGEGNSSNGMYDIVYDTGSYYTFQGVKLMASLSFDPKAYVPMPLLGPEDLKIYGEWALLGVKDYSYMYSDRWQRMPWMLGFNLPTFKLLDVLSVEGQYYNSQFTDDLTSLYYSEVPTWNTLTGNALGITPAQYASDVAREKWKWAIYGKKEIIKGIQIYAQVASDEFRPIYLNEAPFPTMVPVTNRNGLDFYYLVRLQFGI